MARTYFWDPVEDRIVQEFDDEGPVIAEFTTESDGSTARQALSHRSMQSEGMPGR